MVNYNNINEVDFLLYTCTLYVIEFQNQYGIIAYYSNLNFLNRKIVSLKQDLMDT